MYWRAFHVPDVRYVSITYQSHDIDNLFRGRFIAWPWESDVGRTLFFQGQMTTSYEFRDLMLHSEQRWSSMIYW